MHHTYVPICQTIPGLDIWDRSTCPWEWFSEAGPDNPGDKHVNMCHTSATARFFCKRCKNPHGYHPTKLRGKVLGERKQEREGKKWTLTFDIYTLVQGLQHKLFLRRFQKVKPFWDWNRKTIPDARNWHLSSQTLTLSSQDKIDSKHLLL